MSKHINRTIGLARSVRPITFHGRDLQFRVSIYTKPYGFLCFRLPIPCHGKLLPLYAYASPDGVPSSATWYKTTNRHDRNAILAPIRKHLLGHNFDAIHDQTTFIVNQLINRHLTILDCKRLTMRELTNRIYQKILQEPIQPYISEWEELQESYV